MSNQPPPATPPTRPGAIPANHVSAPGNEGVQYVIPINTDVVSIAAGYTGLCALLLFGLPGPIAMGLGVWGLLRLRNRPNTRGHVRAWVGILLGGANTILLAIIGYAVLTAP